MNMDIANARNSVLAEFSCEEYDHFGKAAYRIPPKKKGGKPGRTFMTFWIEDGFAVLMLDQEMQAELISKHPKEFRPHPSKWGAKGATIVRLEGVSSKLFLGSVAVAYDHASR